jgi:hypothetical protein
VRESDASLPDSFGGKCHAEEEKRKWNKRSEEHRAINHCGFGRDPALDPAAGDYSHPLYRARTAFFWLKQILVAAAVVVFLCLLIPYLFQTSPGSPIVAPPIPKI